MAHPNEVVRIFQQHCARVISDPPVTAERVIEMIRPIADVMPAINVYIHAHREDHRLINMLIDLQRVLFYNCLCDKYDAFIEAVNMDYEHPSTKVMLLMHVVANITMPLHSIGAPHILSPAVFAAGSAADDTPPELKYTVREIIDALAVVAQKWYRTAPTHELLNRLLRILLRACIVYVIPMSERIHNIPALRRAIKLPSGADAFAPTSDFLRRMSGGLVRMIIAARFRALVPTRSEFAYFHTLDDIRARCNDINAALARKARELDGAAPMRKELEMLFNVSGQVFGDLDVFVEKRNNDPPKPLDVIFEVKQQGIQIAWKNLNQTLILDRLVQLREDAPFYHQLCTFAHHFYAQNMKLYAAGVYMKPKNVRFMEDYCVAEQDFVPMRSKWVAAALAAPIILQSMGMLHVFYKNELYRCICAEHALLTWITIIMREEGGRINGEIVETELAQLLNEKPPAPLGGAHEVWRADADVTAGIVDSRWE